MNVWRKWQQLKAWWRRWPSWLRAAWTSAGQGLVAVLLLSTLTVLDQVRLWLDHGPAPDLSVYLRGLGDAGVLFAAALVTAVHRRLRPPERAYDSTNKGA